MGKMVKIIENFPFQYFCSYLKALKKLQCQLFLFKLIHIGLRNLNLMVNVVLIFECFLLEQLL